MNPQLLTQAAAEHRADLRRSADHARLAARVATPGPAATIRKRAGWTLVHIGLRLATSSADA